ncbi:chemotaxis protein CheA [Thermovenabulum gondwanense]|uniref:Chemotaxis protein CheA n=1 Tax=Thermovenabulum gondwanense TaxID=520767 RepID=A0A161PT86_9FIRM|nr:chemotaxis protein CheA [Thermovenabulum gondwanense]KYO64565.1 Chemotaxis protein CheA [Thermovenabulum gondwanense]
MDNKYLNVFIEESNEYIQKLNIELLELEKNRDRNVDEIFRYMHTLKGMAGTMGFEKFTELSHQLEDLLDAIRSGNIKISSEVVDVLLEGVDILQEFVEEIADHGQEGNRDISKILEKVKKLIKNNNVNGAKNDKNLIEEKENKIEHPFNEYELKIFEEAFRKNMNIFQIKVILHQDCLLKSARAFLVFKAIENFGEVIKTIPEVREIEDEKFDREFYIYLISNTNQDKIQKSIESISEISEVIITEIRFENIAQKYGIFFNSQNSGNSDEKVSATTENGSKEINKSGEEKDTKDMKKKSGKTLRVDIERLDNLMNLVSELIIIKTRLEEIEGDLDKDQDKREAIEYLSRITSNLHDAVMKVRMVPIENVFNRFPRIVYDLSKELNKKVNLIIEGAETELDRTVIDEIGDPLLHIVRNAIDHGIERPDERVKRGKPEEGTLRMKAYHDGNNVVIEINDDGAGIDCERIARKAVEKGIVDEAKALRMKETELLSLIFEPGFSTSEKITDISGRGVGLDVVKSKIESLGGNVEVYTKKGEGTKFLIRLPLTLAIIQALMIKVDEEKYAIPLNTIRETVIVSTNEIKKVYKKDVIVLRGKVIPLISLHEVLETSKKGYINEKIIVVVVKKGEKDIGIIVDDLIGEQEIVIKSLGNYLKNLKFIAGATILGDGQVALILDINSLFEEE